MSKIKMLINMVIAFILYPFKKYKFKNKEIWLFGGLAGDLYDDNSKFLYEYVLKNYKDIDAYWVINEDSEAKDKIPGKTLVRGSVENYLYYYNAEVIAFSHSPSADIAPYNFAVPVLNRFHKKVYKAYLNHGATGLKRRKPMNPKFAKKIDDLLASYDLAVSAADFEGDIMAEDWKINKDAVHSLGSARYDRLPLDTKPKDKNILYMPTWRDYIRATQEDFIETDYFKSIMNFLNDEKLNETLEKYDVNIKFYLHHLMHAYLDDIKKNITGKRIVFLGKEASVADEIEKASANITDYSGVSFDFLYMNRPVLFYQFDVERYKKEMGAYLDLDTELFGDVAYTTNQAVEKTIKMIESDFTPVINENVPREKFFKHSDNNNCERIYNHIKKELKQEYK